MAILPRCWGRNPTHSDARDLPASLAQLYVVARALARATIGSAAQRPAVAPVSDDDAYSGASSK
jgi:hypothetical protein